MDSKDHNHVIAFDTLFSTNHIRMMKIMLPYMDNQMQKSMAVYIKFLELHYTINYYKKNPYPICGCLKEDSSPDFGKICTELIPYCTEKEKKQMEQIRGILKSMEMYQEISKTMEMMKDFMPDTDMSNLFQNFGGLGDISDIFNAGGKKHDTEKASSSTGSDDFDMINLMKTMLSPEQKEMFELLGGNNNAE